MFFPWLPGQARVMRHSIDWMRAGLPNDNGWENLFYLVLMHGSMTSQVFPRVYTKEEFAQIKAPTLLILGEQEKIYRAKAASQAARRLLPSIQIQFIPQAHHITALANPERVNACLLQFFREGEDG
jgi:pimeloyl-ACP methyl ester carboxylesterase